MSDEKTEITEPRRLSPEEIDELAERIVTNLVYITNSEEGIEYSFMAILALSSLPKSFIENIGAVYEDWSKAGERSINGFPMFLSAKFLHRLDLEPLIARIDAKTNALANA